jgi:hypothetical protein
LADENGGREMGRVKSEKGDGGSSDFNQVGGKSLQGCHEAVLIWLISSK